MRPTHFIKVFTVLLSQVSLCLLLTTAKAPEVLTNQQPTMDSQASLLWAQVMHLAPTLRCPTRRDPTLRALTSMDLDSKALPATLWVSYDDRVASYTKRLQQSLAIRVDRHEHKTSAAFPLRKFLVNTGGRNFTGTSHLCRSWWSCLHGSVGPRGDVMSSLLRVIVTWQFWPWHHPGEPPIEKKHNGNEEGGEHGRSWVAEIF